MRESIANSYLFAFVMVFIGIIIALFVGSLAYSKAFKVKTRIISIIEKHKGYTQAAANEIDNMLDNIGYKVVDMQCPVKNGGVSLAVNSRYNYCVYEYSSHVIEANPNKGKGPYYGVSTFMQFDIPIIGRILRFEVYGETKIIYVID